MRSPATKCTKHERDRSKQRVAFLFASRFLTGSAAGALTSALFIYACRFFPTIDDIPDSHDGVYFVGLNLVQIAAIGIALPLVTGVVAIFTINQNQRSRLTIALVSLAFTLIGCYVSWRMFTWLVGMSFELGVD